MSHPAFFKLIILGENEYEFWTDQLITHTLATAYSTGECILGAENVYGYVIVLIEQDSWSVVGECVYGCDYTVYEHNGKVSVKKGRDRLVMV